jgi:hypothetical protein
VRHLQRGTIPRTRHRLESLLYWVATLWRSSAPNWKVPLTVNLPNQQHSIVAEAVVRWGRQNEYGIETIAIQKHSHQRLQQFISDRLCRAGRRHGWIRF